MIALFVIVTSFIFFTLIWCSISLFSLFVVSVKDFSVVFFPSFCYWRSFAFLSFFLLLLLADDYLGVVAALLLVQPAMLLMDNLLFIFCPFTCILAAPLLHPHCPSPPSVLGVNWLKGAMGWHGWGSGDICFFLDTYKWEPPNRSLEWVHIASCVEKPP